MDGIQQQVEEQNMVIQEHQQDYSVIRQLFWYTRHPEILLSNQKAMTKQEGTMKLIHVNETIMEIFEVTGFSEILTIE